MMYACRSLVRLTGAYDNERVIDDSKITFKYSENIENHI